MRAMICFAALFALARANLVADNALRGGSPDGGITALRGGKKMDMAGLLPKHIEDGTYTPLIRNKFELEEALDDIKRGFEAKLKKEANLIRVSAPLFVDKASGFNDNLNGVERPAAFSPRDFGNLTLEVPFSLAKWKRWALLDYDLPEWQGLVTDFRGLRCDDDVDYLHSLYVDQFDWEMRIPPQSRNIETLKKVVRRIYRAVYETEQETARKFGYRPILPEEIHFASSDEIASAHPDATPQQREKIICAKYKAVFVMGIGGYHANGRERHGGRAPDYDDWSTPRDDGGFGLNGDLLVWHPVLKQQLELSSMGIRVSPNVLLKQLRISGAEERLDLMWHKLLMDGSLPQSIGGGIGQSRLCQFMLRTAHIGEVQFGWWHPDAVQQCTQKGISLLGLGAGADLAIFEQAE
eukprot:CAMPEP_0117006436 /NCGR_PEP_ID=MMETSP0472-20121206/6663_1 /TAXON_ID=693140 ORGANISM="Tiarina fusus, Strain LIS" /NCGR_SAMPLE_ID=MMETSP0472 /ASSEMBLY_ACC=CAM_ASM_000603 /LENGTH=408 /DNA_ID=CAMNT_0004707897 /DNA_START=85 /DNA_END=1311 /DNA_ORIENTATION=+